MSIITAQATERGDLLVLLRAITPLTGAANVGEVHVATEGEWKGHSNGPFQFTGEVFDEMIALFNAQSNPLTFDYEHRTFNEKAPDSTAAGWIQKLEKRQGPNGWELWAITEWTDRAASMIRAGEYKFCSPAFKFAGEDRKTGKPHGAKLRNVALTNDPFLDGNHPIQLSWLAAAAAPPPPPAKAAPPAEEAEEPTEAAPPEPTAEEQQARALNEQLTAAIDQMCSTSGLDRAAVVERLMTMADEIGGKMRDRADQDGSQAEERKMSATEDKGTPSADEQRIAAIAAEATKNEVQILASQVAALKADNDARDAREKAEKDAANLARIDGMVKCGALLESERGDTTKGATWLLMNHPEQFEEIYKGRKGLGKAVPIGVSQAGNETHVSTVVDPEKGTAADLRTIDKPFFNGLIACRVPVAEALKRTFAARADIDKDALRFGLEVQ